MCHDHMAEKTSTVNTSFRQDLLNQIDEVARLYIDRKRRMDAALESIRETVRERETRTMMRQNDSRCCAVPSGHRVREGQTVRENTGS